MKKLALIALASALLHSQTTKAHLEPKKNSDFEKCYGIAKAGKNDCSSTANKHACMGLAKTDADPNEWVKTPKGLCAKLVNGNVKAK